MASTNKFELSGLSDWLEDDRPERMDFVEDNRILDEDAMWKATYDTGGLVADAGGIVDYVQAQAAVGNMAKAEYDPDEAVAAVGIPAYVGLAVQAAADTQSAATAAHTGNTENPHGVTKAQLGLGEVTNAAQMPLAGGTFTGLVAPVHADSNGYYSRGIFVRNSASAGVATSRILMNRK